MAALTNWPDPGMMSYGKTPGAIFTGGLFPIPSPHVARPRPGGLRPIALPRWPRRMADVPPLGSGCALPGGWPGRSRRSPASLVGARTGSGSPRSSGGTSIQLPQAKLEENGVTLTSIT